MYKRVQEARTHDDAVSIVIVGDDICRGVNVNCALIVSRSADDGNDTIW